MERRWHGKWSRKTKRSLHDVERAGGKHDRITQDDMAVLVEGISVIVKRTAIDAGFPGGWQAFIGIVPNQTLCADDSIARVGFMHVDDVEGFVKELERLGMTFLRDGNALDIAVVDQFRGPTTGCDWLEFGHVDFGESGEPVAVCRLAGDTLNVVATPDGWKYEGSLSSNYGIVESDYSDEGLKFLRSQNGVDVYINISTGQEVYIGRTKIGE
jgi:hypothetical protein